MPWGKKLMTKRLKDKNKDRNYYTENKSQGNTELKS